MSKILMVTAIFLRGTLFAGDAGPKMFPPVAPAKAQKALPRAEAALKGEVVWVDASRKTIWINLGQADGLKPRTKFQAMQKQDDEVVKGQIEVTRLLAPHLAEARIQTEEKNDPIAKGDLIVP